MLLDGHQKMSFGPASKNFFWTGVEKFPLDVHQKISFGSMSKIGFLDEHQKMSFGLMSKIGFWMGIKNFFLKVQTTCWSMREEVTQSAID